MPSETAGRDPVVAIAPYGLRPGPDLGATPLADCEMPLGCPPGLAGGVLADLGPEDHAVFHPKSGFYALRRPRLTAKMSLVIAEPYAVHGWHFHLLRLYHRRFFRILTRREAFVAAIPNAVFFNHVFAWATDVPDGIAKTRPASIIASDRDKLEGHRLRHRIVAAIRAEGLDVDVLGRGYQPFEDKWDGLAPYRYSVVIENSRERHYYTEKLIDAFLCRTIPIYWGAPNVSETFDTGGMILCETEAALVAALRDIPDHDSAGMAAAVEANHATARGCLASYTRMAELLLREGAA